LICIGLGASAPAYRGCVCAGAQAQWAACHPRSARSPFRPVCPARAGPLPSRIPRSVLRSWSPARPKEEVAERLLALLESLLCPTPGSVGRPLPVSAPHVLSPRPVHPLPRGLREPCWSPHRRRPRLFGCPQGARADTRAQFPGVVVCVNACRSLPSIGRGM